MSQVNFPEIEKKLVEYWKTARIFERSINERPLDKPFSFYDGPPFATGLPHYGHIVASTLKDVVPRYATMRGYRVERRWGWDCHGLPIENLLEQELGLHTKQDIEKIGVAKFNEACKNRVLTYAEDWKVIIERLGRWVDMDNDYRTMDATYTESIWWIFKTLYERNFIYEGKKAMHICPRCETTLSNFEVTQGYKDVTDQAMIVQFALVSQPNTYVLAWTTTPWTLPGNVGLAVGKDIHYVKISYEDNTYILAKELVIKVFEGKNYQILGEVPVTELVGQEYTPLFSYFKDVPGHEKLFKIWAGEFVNTDEGTGVVHIAGGYGEDDYNLSLQHNLPIIQHVGMNGRFIDAVTDFAGDVVKPIDNRMATDQKILNHLQATGNVFSHNTYLHSYPHCWRCDTPLLNYAATAWFVKVTALKDRMMQHNETITWVPEHIQHGRFGKWLEGAKDWAISRERYWGAPLPVWQSEKGDTIVVGSIAELQELSGESPTDLHKQFVDTITFEKDGQVYTRVTSVLDCWFESGSMPYAQQHYPMEHEAEFQASFPAQFIAEGLDQTRGWFYTLLVLSTALFDKPAFKNVIVNGLVLAEDGKKMSKRLKNYPEPSVVLEKYGADALRFYLMNSPVVRSEDLRFSEKGVDQVMKKLILTLWNVSTFYSMFAGDHTISDQPTNSHIMDQWILAYTQSTIDSVTKAMDRYDLLTATRNLENLVQEISTWYVRRSRDRFKGDETQKLEALATLRYVVLTTVKLLAPFTPFVTERIYLDMHGSKDSIHLDTWPEINPQYQNEALLKDMQTVREYVEQILALRESAGIKVRQPLANVMLPISSLSPELKAVLAAEVNVRSVNDGTTLELNIVLTPELQEEGLVREFIRTINAQRKQQKLTIHDKVIIEYSTTSELITTMMHNHLEELKRSTLTQEFVVGTGTINVKINGESIALSIQHE